MSRTARCPCGQLSITVSGEPRYAGICSCLQCQRRTGSAFSYNSYWPKANVVAIAGEHVTWRRGSDSGRRIELHICPTCFGTVFWYADYDPELIGIGVGSFADPTFPPPRYAEWGTSKHSWVKLPDECRQSSGDLPPDVAATL
jgi:hypothetical protein